MGYLQDIPNDANQYGASKLLSVRSASIHFKHIMTEVFTRKSIDIEPTLIMLGMTLPEYMEFMTHRLRRIYHFPRKYEQNPNDLVKSNSKRFFPTIQLLKGHKVCVALDFDGVVTDRRFESLYELCVARSNTVICSANPTIERAYFDRRDISQPSEIFSCKGKVKKLRQLIEISKRQDYLFFIDNEPIYLEIAWLFGIYTFHWNGSQIKPFTRKTK